jgi:hypothetical protein
MIDCDLSRSSVAVVDGEVDIPLPHQILAFLLLGC